MDFYYNMFLQLKQFLINSGRNYDIDLITRAFEYAADLHDGVYRKSGEDYICHPISVAQICANFGYDTDSICAALLHDVVEDCADRTSCDEIKDLFGLNIATLVDGLTKLKTMRFTSKDEETVHNLRKMFFAMSKDPRVMFVKLCDRLHNMRTIASMPEQKQKLISLETMHIFAPVAHRLGIQKIKEELEDLGLQCLDPYGYSQVKEETEKKYGESRDLIEKSQEKIKEQLLADNIKVTVEGRVKTIYSMYRKVFDARKAFDTIYDFYAIRFIVNDIREVYHVLGIVHNLFSYIPDRFKDYIANPKPNNYQSIHTTVINENGIPFEVQIRTKEMHEVAEYGMAAHWKYKSGEEAPEEILQKLKWLKTLVESEHELNDSDEFMMQLRLDLYADEIFVYTPKGDLKSLPKGSTVIDFAYSVHSAIGNKIVGAKINGTIAAIDTELESSQMVEILTSNSSTGPSRDWLTFVKTGEARNKIKQWFKKEKRADNILYGRQEIDKIFKHHNHALTESQKDEVLTNISKRDGFASIDDFYNAIGYGGLSLIKLNARIKEEILKLLSEKNEKDLILGISQITITEEEVRAYNADIIVDGIDNCQIKLSKCCNPLPGDEIRGFMTKGYGMSIHKADCPNYLNLKIQHDGDGRLFDVVWNEAKTSKAEIGKGKNNFMSILKIEAVDDIRLFSALSTTLADMKVSVHSINESKLKNDGNIVINIKISARDAEHVNYIISRLKTIKNVNQADRDMLYM